MSDPLSLYDICQECENACCTEPGPPYVFEEEIDSIINLGKGNFLVKVEGEDYYTIPRPNGCPYLEGGDCSINEVKPKDCKIYPIGFTLDLKPGISVDCPAKDVLSEEFIEAALNIIETLTPIQKRILQETSFRDGYRFEEIKK
ncbi:YkgJ family cysteine cluster protein [Candidatus Woesearchaeota archaeon]|nr:YkgJ family cysteine cluster protein [Candidatus Woesearchaeota archaeon]